MSKDMLGMVSLSAAWGPITDLMQKLAGPEGEQWLEKLKQLMRKQVVIWGEGPVFSQEEAFVIPDMHIATHYQFDECLKLEEGLRIRIARLGDDFKDRIMGNDEAQPGPGLLQYRSVARQVLDMDILLELGDRACTSAAHLFELLCLQPNGEQGSLSVEGVRGGNIFYILGNDNAIWCVKAWWSDRGWEIAASSVGSRFKHPRGDRVFYRRK